MLVQFWNAFNFRSDRLSAPACGRSRTAGSISRSLWELALLLVVVYVPFLQDAFGTYRSRVADWALVLGVSATIVPGDRGGQVGTAPEHAADRPVSATGGCAMSIV